MTSQAHRFLRNLIRPNIEITPAPTGIIAEWNLPVTLRDGTVLRVNVFRPNTPSAVPVIMSAHPYGKDNIPARTRNKRRPPFQARLVPQPHTTRLSEWTSWEAPDPAFWTAHGYAVVNADLRGGGTSEGATELFSDAEAADYEQLIAWAGTRPWSSGRVGLDGVSYLAISQYKVAARRPPYLAAICPWEGLTDLYRDFARPGGIREDGFSMLWSAITRRTARIRTALRREIVRRPDRDWWYEAATPALDRIEVPILVCASFSDHSLHSRGSFEAFRRAGSKHKRLYTHRDGKWCAYYSEHAANTRLRFFDHTLKQHDNGWPTEPPVRLAITEAGSEPIAITAEQTWPPHDLTWRSLNLDAKTGLLVTGTEPLQPASTSFRTPRGRLSFLWTVPDDIDIIGPMALNLAIEMEGADDVFLFATIRKFRAGNEITFEGSYGFSNDSVSKGWQRAAHRELDPTLSTPEQPVHRHHRAEPLRPGEIVEVHIALLPHATRFRRGDELRLDITARWPFRGDPLRGPFPAAYQRSPRGLCTLHTGGPHHAELRLGARPAPGNPNPPPAF